MGFASALTGSFAVVALCTAIYNFWIHSVRKGDAIHLWLGVAALGIVGLGTGTALMYDAASPAEAQRAQLVALSSGLPLTLGFLRFTSLFLRVDIRRLEVAAGVFYLAEVVLANLFPENFFSGTYRDARVAFSDETYVEAELGPLAYALLPAVALTFGVLIPLYHRHLARIGDHASAVFAAVCLWFLCGVNDLAVAAHLYHGPYLIVFGYAVFVFVFTAILVQRFVQSMEAVEASAETLQRVVEERTQELRHKEVQVAHGDRMATLGTLAAGLAHEINNPIAFITANLNQLSEIWKTQEDADLFEDILTETREGVERIRGIVGELLSLARRDGARTEPVDLRRVVRSVLPIVRYQARDRACIETRLDAVPPVLGDERLLGQVVLNLALNAIHAVPDGGPNGNEVTLSTHYEDGSVWLVIRDTGPGIPEEILPRIFDPFFTTKAQGEGTGLGLAVTHQLVTRHHGRVDVATGPGGTTFTVELPRADESTPSVASEGRSD